MAERTKKPDPQPNPDHYPPGDLPKVSQEELRKIRSKPVKDWSDGDPDAVLFERDRAQFKIRYMSASNREDKAERVASAVGTFTIADVSGLLRDHMQDRKARQRGGHQSGGVVESTNRPSTTQVLRAIRRELDNGTPSRDVTGAVRRGGINLSVRQIRNIGQDHGLLPRRTPKGKR